MGGRGVKNPWPNCSIDQLIAESLKGACLNKIIFWFSYCSRAGGNMLEVLLTWAWGQRKSKSKSFQQGANWVNTMWWMCLSWCHIFTNILYSLKPPVGYPKSFHWLLFDFCLWCYRSFTAWACAENSAVVLRLFHSSALHWRYLSVACTLCQVFFTALKYFVLCKAAKSKWKQ